MAARKFANKEDIIKQQLRLSQLKSQKKRLTAEEEILAHENEVTIKENVKYETDNEKLQSTIMMLIQRIDVSTLLKEIDMEEMRHLANQNINMNMAF
jgi:5'-3' exonuclease